MKGNFIIGILFFLSSCSTQHDIGFMNSPCLKPYNGFDFELGSNFMIQVNEQIYIVPKGFITDLASVPRPMWAFYPPNDARTIRAAIIHDYLYSGAVDVSREESDAILYSSLIEQGVSRFVAYKYWLAVRLFGKSHFKEYLHKDLSIERDNR